ncbi:MAG: (2Fe-2S)-binding protein, partial [Beijerinckiaceae bacterium]
MPRPRADISAFKATRFTFNGEEVEARPGESIAAALAASGVLELRRTRSGAPRGQHCGMGSCFDCIVTVDGRTGVRACLEKAQPGMAVSSAAPAADAIQPWASSPAGALP